MKHALIFGLIFLLMAASVLAAAGDCTKFLNASLGTTACVGGNAGIGNFTGAVYGITLNTGQGNYELYAMDQDVLTTSIPRFAGGTIRGDQAALRIENSTGGLRFLAGLRSDVTGNDDDYVLYGYGGQIWTNALFNSTLGGQFGTNMTVGERLVVGSGGTIPMCLAHSRYSPHLLQMRRSWQW